MLDALLRSSAAAHHQPALMSSGEALLALRLRCVASVCPWSFLSGASVRGRADRAKKTASGLREGRASYRLRARVPLHTPTQAGVPDPVERMHEYQYSTYWHLQSGETTSAPPPPFRSCRVCSRPCHILPSCTPVIHPPRGLRASGTVTCLVGMRCNQHRKHPCPACRQVGDPFAQRTQLLVRLTAADPTSGQPCQPAVAQAESQSRALMIQQYWLSIYGRVGTIGLKLHSNSGDAARLMTLRDFRSIR